MPLQTMTVQERKQHLRTLQRAKREALDIEAVSKCIGEQLSAWQGFQRAKHILSYQAFSSEIHLANVQPLARQNWYTTRTWFKPVRLSIHSVACEMERHKYGFMQPVAEAEEVPPERIDLVLVPGLAFDRQGNRLGYGKGFYDRLLASVRPDCFKLAVTAEALLCDEVPSEASDIPMDGYVSENGVQIVQK